MRFLLFSFLMLNLLFSYAQKTPGGIWEGKIDVGVSLRLVFEFSLHENGRLSCILKSPDQSPLALPTDTSYAHGDSIFVSAKKLGIFFSGKLVTDSMINGLFLQGTSFPLQLKKVQKASEVKRPQTPVEPFPYERKELTYFNADKSIQFGATLTYPKPEPGVNSFKIPTFPVVILITGSGPQDRDETILMHKPFAVIADYLSRRGFAVLRVDDRGIGKTTGKFSTATTADFAADVEAGIDYLKTLRNIDTNSIGLIGHSEGGMIAPMVADKRKEIKYIVLLAGPGIPIIDLMASQVEDVGLSNGMPSGAGKASAELFRMSVQLLNNHPDTAAFKNFFKTTVEPYAKQNEAAFAYLKLQTPELRKNYIGAQLSEMNTNWYKYFLAFNPQPYLKGLTCNVLALNGEKDIQVASKKNLAGIRAALKKSQVKEYEVTEIPGLNHLFQTCKKCTTEEYGELEETFSPAALKIMGDWLWKQYIGN